MCTCMSASVSVCGFVTEQHNDNLFIFPKIHFKVLGHNTHTQKDIYLYLKPVKAISPTRSPSRKCTAQRKPNRLYDIKPSIAVSGTRKVNSTAHTTREEKEIDYLHTRESQVTNLLAGALEGWNKDQDWLPFQARATCANVTRVNKACWQQCQAPSACHQHCIIL